SVFRLPSLVLADLPSRRLAVLLTTHDSRLTTHDSRLIADSPREPLVLLNELTRGDLNRIAPEAVVVLPVGATEQHGPPLRVGTDTLAVEAVARGAVAALAERLPVVMAPVLPYGSSHHHLPFGGTMSLATETYYAVIRDLVESLITSQFRRVMIVNG